MYQTSLFPLRTVVGDQVRIGKVSSVRQIFESNDSRDREIQYELTLKPSIGDTVRDPHYYDYLPVFEIDGTTLFPGEGMDTLPIPPRPLPFADDAEVLSLFALSKKKVTSNDVSRKLSARFAITFAEKHLIGGVCFGGLPYLYYSRETLESSGENTANFGLPKEIRISALGTSGDKRDGSGTFEFLDSEIATTRQQIVSESGFHYLLIDPCACNVLTLHVSDYPRFLRRVKYDKRTNKYVLEEYYGFIIPYFYIFEYKEGTRYRPRVSAGTLGTRSNHRVNLPANTKITVKNAFNNLLDFKYITTSTPTLGGGTGTSKKANYFDFTGASCFGQQRKFTERGTVYEGEEPKGKIKNEFRECFISQKLKPGKRVVLYIEQAEEYERCVAGLKIYLPFVPETIDDLDRFTELLQELFPAFPNLADQIANTPRADLERFLRDLLKIPPKTNFCERIGLRVYELDPLEGVSPVSVPLDGEYATLLSEADIDTLSEISLAMFVEGLRFTRSSNSRYFAVELTNNDSKAGQIVVKNLKLVQSAHVSIHPRAAKTQQIRTLNFRIIGADLAEDYALLGNDGFNFSIERLVAGERKSVLFSATSLLDLLHAGTARIFSNIRRRAVEFEKSETYPVKDDDTGAIKYLVPDEFDQIGGQPVFTANNEKRFSEVLMDGWRRSRTGDGVTRKSSWTGEKNPGTFKNINNAETRTHVELISPQEDINEWKSNAFIGNALFQIRQGNNVRTLFGNQGIVPFLGPNQTWIPTYNSVKLFDGFHSVWKGIIDPNETDTTRATHQNRLKVTGVKSVTSSPFGLNALSTEFFDMIDALIAIDPNNLGDPTDLANALIEFSDFATLMGLALGSHGLIFGLSTANSLSAGLSMQPAGIGVTFSASTSGGLILPSYTYVNSFGTQGSITKQASKTGYADSRFRNKSYDEGTTTVSIESGEMKRVITRREVPGHDSERIKGGEVMWQNEIVDIITGAIPLNFALPATATRKHFRTADDSLRVRFGSGVGRSVSVDFWFDITEETIRDDY